MTRGGAVGAGGRTNDGAMVATVCGTNGTTGGRVVTGTGGSVANVAGVVCTNGIVRMVVAGGGLVVLIVVGA